VAEGLGCRTRPRAAAEVHAQIAVLVLVRAIAKAVRGVQRGTAGEGQGRQQRDQLITTQSAAHALVPVRSTEGEG
jgi:hypothetical protein